MNRNLFWIPVAVAALVSCNRAGTSAGSADSASVADSSREATVNATTACYLRTEGSAGQDSTRVSLTIADGKVSGTYDWLPYQKDSRKGAFTGTIEGDVISATWRFMQEGVQDSMQIEFKRSGNELLQKKFAAGNDGKMITPADAAYTERFAGAECN